MPTKQSYQTLLASFLLTFYTAIAIGATIIWSRIIWVGITVMVGSKVLQWGIASILVGAFAWCIFIIVRGISRDIKSDKQQKNK